MDGAFINCYEWCIEAWWPPPRDSVTQDILFPVDFWPLEAKSGGSSLAQNVMIQRAKALKTIIWNEPKYNHFMRLWFPIHQETRAHFILMVILVAEVEESNTVWIFDSLGGKHR